MTTLEKAIFLATRIHGNQTYGIFPYMYHIKEVLDIAIDLNLSENIQIACVLHDAIEDGGLSYNDIKDNFGTTVAEIVYAVTDGLGRNRSERKSSTYAKIRKLRAAKIVKLCDRIANVTFGIETNSNKRRMYKKEHSVFKVELEYIIEKDPDVLIVWDKLNTLINSI